MVRDLNILLDDAQLQASIDDTPAAKVTREHIEARIKHLKFSRFAPTVTICQITLDNGYSVRGESACVNVENYDREIGERIAHDNAFNQLWPLFGFLLAEDQHTGRLVE